jgi:hypothetical protein
MAKIDEIEYSTVKLSILDFLIIFLLFAFAVDMTYLGAPGNGFSQGIGHNHALRHLGNILHFKFNITAYFPSLYIHHQRPIFLTWLAAAIALTLFTLALAWRKQSSKLS